MSLLQKAGVNTLRIRAKELRRTRKRALEAYKLRTRDDAAAKKKVK